MFGFLFENALKYIHLHLGNLLVEVTPGNRMKLVKQFEKLVIKLNVPRNITYYNAVLNVYLDNEHKFSTTKFMKKFKQLKIIPNRYVLDIKQNICNLVEDL